MKIASILENQKIEKRVAITPEIAKKYISLGFEVSLSENYGSHLGIKDEEYKKLGASILKDEKQIITNTDILAQLTLLDEDKSSILKENQTLIGVLNPYDNKDKINDLIKKKNQYLFTRTTSKNNKSSVYGHIIFTSKPCGL
jgi:NAD(P) transhydrogenase subunit alpha